MMASARDGFLKAANDNEKPVTPVVMGDHQVRLLILTHQRSLMQDLFYILTVREQSDDKGLSAYFERRLRIYREDRMLKPSCYDDTHILNNLAGSFAHVQSTDLIDCVFEKMEKECDKRLSGNPKTALSMWSHAAQNTSQQFARFNEWEETISARQSRQKHGSDHESYIRQFIRDKNALRIRQIEKDAYTAVYKANTRHQSLAITRVAPVIRLAAFR